MEQSGEAVQAVETFPKNYLTDQDKIKSSAIMPMFMEHEWSGEWGVQLQLKYKRIHRARPTRSPLTMKDQLWRLDITTGEYFGCCHYDT